jgi:hypothetical protein
LSSLCALLVITPVLASRPGPGTSTGSGQVFLPNPVAALQDQTLTDLKDANYPALQPAYQIVVLTNLDGSGFLSGDWANVRSTTGDLAYSLSNTFVYTRDDDRFEQVMAYYWVTEAQKYIAVVAATPDPACVADWDSVSYTSQTPHCLRRVDGNLHYPEDLNGRVHHDGQIWSRALWDIRARLGHVQADTLILEAQFNFAPDTSMPDAALDTVAAAELLYGSGAATMVREVFQDRGILP